VTSPRERAKLLDAEMQLQRTWLEMSLREFGSAQGGMLTGLNPLKIGLSFFKHRSLWVLAASVLANLYRRHLHKVKS
jgi:hypothetical protein